MLFRAGARRSVSARMPMEDDAEVVRSFLASRDDDLFALLVERHKDRVFRLIVSVLGPAAANEAEEVTQEVFLLVYRRLASFRMESRFATWLYRIAYNRAIDARRTARLRLPHCSDERLASLPARDGASDPAARAEETERRAAVHASLEEIPDLYRAVLYQYYWLEEDVAEIGAALGVPSGTVKSYLHRARQALEARMRRKGLSDV